MKKILLVLLVCSGLGAFAQKADFSGDYKLNKDKVDWNGAPEYVLPRYIKVGQGKDQTIISRVQLDMEMKERSAVADTLSFKGTAFNSISERGKVVTTLKWLNDLSFELNREASSPDGEDTTSVHEVWTLEDGGKTLVVNREVKQGDGNEYTLKAYFDRK